MILQAGPNCDVCGHYILLDSSINTFTMPGITNDLHCHDRCKKVLLEAIDKNDWRLLPVGRIREAFATQAEVGL